MIPPKSQSAARSLAYELGIARAPQPASEPEESKPAEAAIPPFETKSTPEPQAPAPDTTAATPPAEPDQPDIMARVPEGDIGTQQDVPPPHGGDPYANMPPLPGEQAGAQGDMPPDEGENGDSYGAYDNAAPLPGESANGAQPWDGNEQGVYGNEQGAYGNGQGAYGNEQGAYGNEQSAYGNGQGAYGNEQSAYGDEQNAYGNGPGADPWAQQDAAYPAEPSEEWVQVVISGAAMRASAADDAAMLFAFPYGRKLRVVSRYEGWLEVTDPKSSATGWMQAHLVAPASSMQPDYGQDQTAYEEPRERRGLFRKGGFADMIQRAFGGN